MRNLLKRNEFIFILIVGVWMLNSCDTLNSEQQLNPLKNDQAKEIFTLPEHPVVINLLNSVGLKEQARVSIVELAQHGNTSTLRNGSLLYTPLPGFVGEDAVGYEIVTASGSASNFVVKINVSNDEAGFPCEAGVLPDIIFLDEFFQNNELLIIDVIANDIFCSSCSFCVNADPSSITIVSEPMMGKARVENNHIVYQPLFSIDNFFFDVFVYKVAKAGYPNTVGYASVLIGYFNEGKGEWGEWDDPDNPFLCSGKPKANQNDIQLHVDPEEPIPAYINVLGNDYFCPQGLNWNSLKIVIEPEKGKASFDKKGGVVYTPNTNSIGTDIFIYEFCHTNGDCTQGKVLLNLISFNANQEGSGSASGDCDDASITVFITN